MSDPKVNNNLIKSQDIIETPLRVKELAEYSSSKSITPSTELLIEFLSAVMTKDYELALRYCTEILNREPNNTTAMEFYPLIVEKLQMIENKELESSSSESSISSSSTSSSSASEKNLFHNEYIEKASLYEWGKSYTSCAERMSLERTSEDSVSNPNTLKKEPTRENTSTTESNISLTAKPKKAFLQNVELNKKKTNNETPLPSNLLIHPTQTTTLIGNNVSNKTTKTVSRSKQEKRIPNVSQQQPPPKLQLHMTQTVTFPKRVPPPNQERTGHPQ